MDASLATRPLSYKELIKESFRFYQASFSKVILLSLLLSITVFIPRILSNVIGQDIYEHVSPLSPYRLWLIVIELTALVFFIAIFWRMHCSAEKIREPLIQDLKRGAKKTISVFIASLLQGAILFAVAGVILGLELLLHQYNLFFGKHLFGVIVTTIIFATQAILILYIMTLFYFYVPLIAVENKSIFGSLGRSVSLVWNHWWRVFSLQMTPWIVYILLLMLIKYTLGIDIHIYFTEYTQPDLAATILHLIIFTLFIPWIAALLFVQVNDLEIRHALERK